MIYTFATGDNEAEIKRLLAENDLHHTDITANMLCHFLLAFDGPGPVAVVGLEIKPPSGLLRSLAVDPGYRSRGIAAQLVGKIEEHAKSSQVETLYLLTMTAAEFFKKHGYRPTERNSAPAGIQQTAEFQTLCPVSAVCMMKPLGH